MERRRSWMLFLLLALLSLLAPAVAKSPTSFCKCTCFGKSRIFALDPPADSEKPKPPSSRSLEERASRKKTCNDCNRQFCLGYTFCKGEKEENVLTACFQRDSAKDQAVVYIFIIATVGLLSYAAVRPWVDKWAERTRERRDYIPVSSQTDQ
ncbi:uncharacterized protein EI97DRAFT_470886 [Westerdykella ornata]|uniref:Uncharacterized protein n=1 Tax=Westerdykella ornata TaxID=318751 RepID=A0A6A6J996_WESOR|nr:uncharacterized protein EI97DRAFT_470886 [Westerdykella ornata]KAF2271789.1 hypothetical protein EI97DRAFT_470886 [Westerdykella ornata]